MDLDEGTKVDYLYPGKVAQRKTISEIAAKHDPGKGRHTIAAINGDFFDMNGTVAPWGTPSPTAPRSVAGRGLPPGRGRRP
ncbi:hypothetical protein NKH77_22695 [Streptomyces sp. M19]